MDKSVIYFIQGLDDAFLCLGKPLLMKYRLSVSKEIKERVIKYFSTGLIAKGLKTEKLEENLVDMIITPGGFHIYLDILPETTI